MSLEMTRGPLAEGFRGGAGGGGGGGVANTFWKKTERRNGGEQAADLLPARGSWSDLWDGFGVLQLGQGVLLGVVAVHHKPSRSSGRHHQRHRRHSAEKREKLLVHGCRSLQEPAAAFRDPNQTLAFSSTTFTSLLLSYGNRLFLPD